MMVTKKRNEKAVAEVTLQEALELTYRSRWAHARDGGKCLYSQAKQAAEDVALACYKVDGEGRRDGPIANVPVAVRSLMVGEVAPSAIRRATTWWYHEGLAPATINKRLNCLSAMGVTVEGCRVKEPKRLKWWLKPSEQFRALKHLRGQESSVKGVDRAYLTNHILWTTVSGLRVEETLRLTLQDFGDGFSTVTVPGLKTSESQATLPLGTSGATAAQSLMRNHFTSYEALEAAWRKLRADMGWPPEATLKGLRRTAARYLHVSCNMPLDMVRQYLRHENIATTMEYLRLTGGYAEDEMRRYLDKEERP